MASEIIDTMSGSWNKQLVEVHFYPVDAKVIRSIPMLSAVEQYFWAWHFEHNGVFSVRPTYRMLANTKKPKGRLAGGTIFFLIVTTKMVNSGQSFGRRKCHQRFASSHEG
jgi:hypothetical protein